MGSPTQIGAGLPAVGAVGIALTETVTLSEEETQPLPSVTTNV